MADKLTDWITRIPEEEGELLWNRFCHDYSDLVPLSFNPDLLSLYQQQFSWKPYYLLIYDGELLTGLFPLINTGRAWVSLPHFSYGGLLHQSANKDLLVQLSVEGLIPELEKKKEGYYRIIIAADRNGEHTNEKIFIRSFYPGTGLLKSAKVSSIMPVITDEEQTFNLLGSSLRRKIRKSYKDGITYSLGGAELLDDFYAVYVKNIRQLKSLNYGADFFSALCRHWTSGHCLFVIAKKGSKAVGAAMLLEYRGFFENVFFATLTEYRKHYVSDGLHWEMMRFIAGCDNSPRYYSFGRSTMHSGVFDYKSHWPVEHFPIHTMMNYPDIRERKVLHYFWGLLPPRISRRWGKKLVEHIY